MVGLPRLKLKGIQEFFLIDFDASAHKGKKVQRAELRMKSVNDDAAMRVTFSTVKTEWSEGQGIATLAIVMAVVSFGRLRGKKRWAEEGSDITSVTFGNAVQSGLLETLLKGTRRGGSGFLSRRKSYKLNSMVRALDFSLWMMSVANIVEREIDSNIG